MIIPPFLKKGDTIGIIAPARSSKSDELQPAIKLIESFGYKVIFASNVFTAENQFAGNDMARASALNYMIYNNNVKAILAARGGYGSIRIADQIDYKTLQINPKWILGFSDITVLHSIINKKDIATIHSSMPINMSGEKYEPENVSTIIDLLEGKLPKYTFDSKDLNIEGAVEGRIVGGNLSVIYSMRGTKYDIDTDNKILFLEDLDEYLYHIDRMMMNLKLGAKLNKIKGLIIGSFSEMKDNAIPFGKSAEEIIYEYAKDLNIPVCFGFPAGHTKANLPIPFGIKAKLTVSKTKSEVSFLCS